MPDPEIIQSTSADGEPLPGLRIGPVDVFFGSHRGKYPDGNFVVVQGSDSRIAFDTPLVTRRLPLRCRAADAVVLSHVHEDHTAALDLMANTPLYVHSGDIAAARSLVGLARHYGYGEEVNVELCRRAVERFHFQPRPKAIAFEHGFVWDLGRVRVRAIHAPGHTSGHCILMVEPDGIAFIGDIDLSTFGPYYGDATSDLPSFRATLRDIRTMPANCWITYHHKGVITSRAEFLAQLDRFEGAIDRREAALLATVAAKPRTLHELTAIRFVYPSTFDDVYVKAVEQRTIVQHLNELVERGAVRLCDGLYAAH
jgi:glyoxylase-like metal-dependent hydrolase (beta-lactamase superfamily II)